MSERVNNMKREIIEIAKSEGIDLIGFTTVLDYTYMSDILNEKIKNGYDSEFEEHDINKRLDVRNIFPKCKTIIAVGVPYATGYKRPMSKDSGLLSVVSHGEDYHSKLNKILYNLAEKIKKYVNFEYEICVDTSPLIDKEICKNAGLGNYGKNTLLINEVYGSFINLGYILTDLEIEGTEEIKNIDICGDCNICVRSCPNGAILEQGGLNSKKCVSYLTQTKNYIPLEYRKNMQNQIYGCDICQSVCPKNKLNEARNSNIEYSELHIDLKELLKISNKDFQYKYGHLSGAWRGKNIWKRNAIISAGNLHLLPMYEYIKNELDNPSELIKIYAAWALMKLDKINAKYVLYDKMKYENEKIKKEYLKLMEFEL